MKINIEKINISDNDNTMFVVLADIHHIKSCDEKYYNKLLNTVKMQKPDYILIPGDIIDNPSIVYTNFIQVLIDFFKNLSLLAPVIISKGNHEQRKSKKYINQLYSILKPINNLYVLDNSQVNLSKFRFIGFSPTVDVYVNNAYLKTEEFISQFNAEKFKIDDKKINILLCHSPETITLCFDRLNNSNLLDYVICGHMHNGCIPKILEKQFKTRGLVGPKYILFPKYCRGIHKFGKTKLIVCKSLRVISKDSPMYRFADKLYNRNITVLKI